MFRLDYSKATTLQLSSDAFWWLFAGEEPLDEANLEEADDVTKMFPDGFEIKEGWEEVSGEGLIEATFIPYTQETESYDLKQELSKCSELLLKWLPDGKAQVIWRQTMTDEKWEYGTFEIKTTPKGLKYFERGELGKGNYSRFYLKHFVSA